MKSVAIWKGKADYLWIFQKAVLCHCLRVGEKGSSGRCVRWVMLVVSLLISRAN